MKRDRSNRAEPQVREASKAQASPDRRPSEREVHLKACLARHWEAMNSAEQVEAIERAEMIGRSAGRHAFLVVGRERIARPLDYYKSVIGPLFAAGTMMTAWHDRWQAECCAMLGKPTGMKDRPTDPRVAAFIREWEVGQRDNRG